MKFFSEQGSCVGAVDKQRRREGVRGWRDLRRRCLRKVDRGAGWIKGKVRRTSDGDKSNKSDQSKEKRNSVDAPQWQNLIVQERDHPGQKTGLRRQWN
ncbi:hypothetical protein CK203_046371 [Vitis vinifera]|uniref:Uncharacterized protein n=1 Tax=Vitis vinifera TaxID=29760 RepID=A0A438FW92_VITVI|nr:hypothetical protein CK203_046371 [Vitis vinifera]